jgi:hypothetical protein
MHTYVFDSAAEDKWSVGYWQNGLWKNIRRFKEEQDAVDFVNCLNGGELVAVASY